LNALGYGVAGSGLKLDLVYNPGGAFLPPAQEMLHAKYTEELQSKFGVVFNELFTMTNMPIKRFADLLAKQGKLEESAIACIVSNQCDRAIETFS
jgi:hypothetical protein